MFSTYHVYSIDFGIIVITLLKLTLFRARVINGSRSVIYYTFIHLLLAYTTVSMPTTRALWYLGLASSTDDQDRLQRIISDLCVLISYGRREEPAGRPTDRLPHVENFINQRFSAVLEELGLVVGASHTWVGKARWNS